MNYLYGQFINIKVFKKIEPQFETTGILIGNMMTFESVVFEYFGHTVKRPLLYDHGRLVLK